MGINLHNGLDRVEREKAIQAFHPGGGPHRVPERMTLELAKQKLLDLALKEGLRGSGVKRDLSIFIVTHS